MTKLDEQVKDYGAAVLKRDALQALAGRVAAGEVEPCEARAIAAYAEKLFMYLSEFVPAEVKREHARRNGKTGEGEGAKEAPRRSTPVPPSPRMYA